MQKVYKCNFAYPQGTLMRSDDVRLEELRAKLLMRESDLCNEIERNIQLNEENKALRGAMVRMREDGALVVNALDRSIQLWEALFAFMPPGTVMSPAVSTCKAAFEEAMRAVRRRQET
jgi:hypothetical protein